MTVIFKITSNEKQAWVQPHPKQGACRSEAVRY